nr:hypothetical protein [Tanacetum cinerariifolium]
MKLRFLWFLVFDSSHEDGVDGVVVVKICDVGLIRIAWMIVVAVDFGSSLVESYSSSFLYSLSLTPLICVDLVNSGEVGGVENKSSMGSMLISKGEECLDGWVGAGRGEVKGGVDVGVTKILLGETSGESGGEGFGVDRGAV